MRVLRAGSGRMAPCAKTLGALLFFSALCSLSAQAEAALHGSVETLVALPFSTDLGLTDSRAAFAAGVSASAGQASAFASLAAAYNGISPDRTGFFLEEAWADWSAGGFFFRLGRQFLSWGAADGLILTDVVCPQNLGAYAGLDFAGSRLAVDGLKLGYSFPAFDAEAVWLPLFTPARLPGDPRNPLYGIVYPAALDLGGTALPVSVLEALPPRTITDGEYGLRLSWHTPALDLSVMGFFGWNDLPFMEKSLILSDAALPAGLALQPEYGRTVTAGADASVPLGDFLLRLEAAWTGGGRYDRSAEDTAAALVAGRGGRPVEKHNLKALAGLDWNPSGWTLSAQYYEDLLPDARGGGTERPWRKSALTLRVGRGFFRETLHIAAWCFVDLQDFDAAGSVSAVYALTDSFSLSLGGDFFTGGPENRGTYGAYTELNCLWIKGLFLF